MFSEFIAIIQSFLTEPAILIGLLVGLGYALDKKSPIKIITGMVSAMVGLMMVLFGGLPDGFLRHESGDPNCAWR